MQAFLDEERVLTCASLGRDGWPHLMPLWYVVRDGECWAWTYAKSQKVRNLERESRCTLQVEAGDTLHGAARRDDQGRVRDPPRPGVVAAVGTELARRYGDGDATSRRAQAAKRVALQFVTARRRLLGPPQAVAAAAASADRERGLEHAASGRQCAALRCARSSARRPITSAMDRIHRATWLCPDAASRERLLDMDERLQRPRAIAFALIAVGIGAAAPLIGWWGLWLLVVAVLGFRLAQGVAERIAAPEYALFASWAVSELVIAGSVAVTGGITSYTASWLLVPLVTLPARFGTRGVGAGVAFIGVLVTAIAHRGRAEPAASAHLRALRPADDAGGRRRPVDRADALGCRPPHRSRDRRSHGHAQPPRARPAPA